MKNSCGLSRGGERQRSPWQAVQEALRQSLIFFPVQAGVNEVPSPLIPKPASTVGGPWMRLESAQGCLLCGGCNKPAHQWTPTHRAF